MTSIPPLEAEMAVLLERLEPPSLPAGFADRVLAAAAIEPIPPIPRLRRPHWRRRAAIGVAIGLLGAAAAVAMAPPEVLRKLPVIGAIVEWASPASAPAPLREPEAAHRGDAAAFGSGSPPLEAEEATVLPAVPWDSTTDGTSAPSPARSPAQAELRQGEFAPVGTARDPARPPSAETLPVRELPRTAPDPALPEASEMPARREAQTSGEAAADRPAATVMASESTAGTANERLDSAAAQRGIPLERAETRRQMRERTATTPDRREPSARPPRSVDRPRVRPRGQ